MSRSMQPRGEELERLGLQLAGQERTDVLAECLRVARRLLHLQGKVFGLLPASPDLGVQAVTAHLGCAVAELTGGTVACVDANVRWPAIAGADGGGSAGSGYATRWLKDGVALLSPERSGAAGAGVPQLARLIRESSEVYGWFVVDLTGFKPFGEHLAAVEMMDGVVIVARFGLTREEQLRRMTLELPPAKNLGVLLVGGRPE